MELYTIEAKKYKNIFLQTLAPRVLIVVASYLLVSNGFYLLSGFDPGKKLTVPVLLFLTLLATIYGQYQKKRLAKLQEIIDFELRLEEYEKFYTFRLLWFSFSCLISCLLSLLTGRYFFLYFPVFDVLITLPLFPNLNLFKRELKNEDILII